MLVEVQKPLKEISFGKVLLRLFQTSRRFGVEIQPQLTMLQKTLLNVEGLGRDLDANLDLWKTAHPYLERWMSEQMGWRSALNNLKSELPYWGKILPQMPRLIHQQLERNLQTAPTNVGLQHLVREHQRQTRWLKLISVALILLVVLQSTIALLWWFSQH